MIQQKAQIQLILNGDGTATTFAFDLGRTWGLYFPPGPEVEGPTSTSTAEFVVINPGAEPDGVVVDFAKLPNQSTVPGTITPDVSRHIVTLTFSEAPNGPFFVGLSLVFNG